MAKSESSLLSIIEQLAEFDTALLANTIGYIDPTPAEEIYMGGSIASVTPALGPTVGLAVTCEVDSSTPGAKADWEPYYRLLEEMAENPNPMILVAKAVGSRPDHECVLGDGMAKELHVAGFVGLVTDGGVRDVEGLLDDPLCRLLPIPHGPPLRGAVRKARPAGRSRRHHGEDRGYHPCQCRWCHQDSASLPGSASGTGRGDARFRE